MTMLSSPGVKFGFNSVLDRHRTSEEMVGTASGGRWWYPHQWLSPSGAVFGISVDSVSLDQEDFAFDLAP